ncbi:hypothetical protein [Providencia sp. Me31A]|uniref:hypothetical protein n=1 Tax=Providencia sp. Me31A TaxID=3392637 RepID=UPI003D2CB1A9
MTDLNNKAVSKLAVDSIEHVTDAIDGVLINIIANDKMYAYSTFDYNSPRDMAMYNTILNFWYGSRDNKKLYIYCNEGAIEGAKIHVSKTELRIE